MIAAEAQPSQLPSCAWLDGSRGPKGEEDVLCRLTRHIFGPGSRAAARCLSICALPAQQARGRCRHMDLANVILDKKGDGLPRIHCLAHHNYDAPNSCSGCRDYLPA